MLLNVIIVLYPLECILLIMQKLILTMFLPQECLQLFLLLFLLLRPILSQVIEIDMALTMNSYFNYPRLFLSL